MARTISPSALKELFSETSGEVFLVLLTIDDPSLAEPIRVVNDRADHVSRGDTFTAFAFEVAFSEETAARPGQARLTIDNVDRSIVSAVRSATGDISVLMEVVMASTPDTVEASARFTMRNIEWNAQTVSGDLLFEDFLNETYPAQRFTPADFPGLF